MNDNYYMKKAIELAVKGDGKVSPNPLVGAVIVKDNEIIGYGYHEKYGDLHAERNAFKNCKIDTTGATIFVTLEPCCHFGKTPPCTDIIIEKKIKRVVIGSLDPNPKVSGKGVAILQEAGIDVTIGVLENECVSMNKIFFHYIKTKTPYVKLKYAMTIDGKIATMTGHSKWITDVEARENVHKDRNKYTAIMIGVNTLIVDDPMLDCRIKEGVNPIRVICDTNLRTPINSKIVETSKDIRTIIATKVKNDKSKIPFLEKGVEVLSIDVKDNKIDLQHLVKELGKMSIDSILLEGGSELNFSAIDSKIVNATSVYIAPKIVGGATAKSPIGGNGVPFMSKAINLINSEIIKIGNDFLIESEVIY